MPISPSVCLSVSVISPSPCSSDGSSYVWNAWFPRNLEIMSPDDWCSLKLLPSWSCETGEGHLYVSWLYQLSVSFSVSVIIVALTTCSQTFIKPSFVFCLPTLHFLSHISTASIPFFACELKAVTPYKRGFFCGDSSITYPYLEREAIPDSLLIAGGIAITGLTVRQ